MFLFMRKVKTYMMLTHKDVFLWGLLGGSIYFPFILLTFMFGNLANITEIKVDSLLLIAFNLCLSMTGIGGAIRDRINPKFGNKIFTPRNLLVFQVLLILITASVGMVVFYTSFKTFIILQFATFAIWYGLLGGLVVSVLSPLSADKRLRAWGEHCFGLLVGYSISYLFISDVGAFGILISTLALLVVPKVRTMIVSIFAIFIWVAFDGESTLLKKIDSHPEIRKVTSASFLHFINDEIVSRKLVYQKWSRTSLIQIYEITYSAQRKEYAAFVNRQHVSSLPGNLDLKSLSDRDYYRGLLFPYFYERYAEGEKALVGVGIGRSLLAVDEKYLDVKTSLIDITGEFLEFAKQSHFSPVSRKMAKATTVASSGRYFFESSNKKFDFIFFESAFRMTKFQEGSMSSSNLLLGKESIEAYFKKLSEEGMLIFEATIPSYTKSWINNLKFYLLKRAWIQLGKRDAHLSLLVSPDNRYLILLVAKTLNSLNTTVDFIESRVPELRKESIKFISEKSQFCEGDLSDGRPFHRWTCERRKSVHWFKFLVLMLVPLLIITFFLSSRSSKNRVRRILFLVGFIQSVFLNLALFNFKIYVAAPETILIFCILSLLLGNILGSTLFLKLSEKKSTGRILVQGFIFSSIIFFFVVINRPTLLYEAIIGKILVVVLVFVVSTFLATLFTFNLVSLSKGESGKGFLAETSGYFVGYLSLFALYVPLGLSYYLGFYFLLMLIFYHEFRKLIMG